jgi:hypothetical protein
MELFIAQLVETCSRNARLWEEQTRERRKSRKDTMYVSIYRTQSLQYLREKTIFPLDGQADDIATL